MKKGERRYNDGMSPALRYYYRNRENILQKLKGNPAVAARVKLYRQEKNPDRVRMQKRIYASANPDKMRVLKSTQRARKRNATGIVSRDIVAKLMTLQRGQCAVCRCDLRKEKTHLDHIEPLALGGAHDDKNMQLLCKPCNLSKHAKPPIEFMQSRGFLL